MDKFFRKNKGAISIFLVIVMLPMMTVASVFVDMSRIKLANAMAESAGDLALNTALTNYDTELKNLYGLFATAQDMDEMMESLEDYYRDSIVGAGVDPADADDYVDQIMDYLGTTIGLKEATGTDNLMNIEISDFEVSSPTGANLGNPAILKSQIVEFMKYRGPVELGMGFLDALSAMKDLSKQTELVEDKNKFYEKHQDLLGTLEDAWWQIQLYQYADAKSVAGFPTGSYLTDQGALLAENAKKWTNTEMDIIGKSVKYLYRSGFSNTVTTHNGGLQYYIELSYVCPDCENVYAENKTQCTSCNKALDKSVANQQWTLLWGGVRTTMKANYSEDDPASADDLLTELNATLKAVRSVNKYTTGENSKAYELAAAMPDSSSVKSFYTMCIFNEDLSKSNNYFKSVKTLLQCLVNLNAAYNTCDEEDLKNIKITQVGEDDSKLYEQTPNGTPIGDVASRNLDKHSNLNRSGKLWMFNEVSSRIAGHYKKAEPMYQDAVKVLKEIDSISSQAKAYDALVERKIGNLASAISLLSNVKNQISDPNSEYYKALQAWKSSANNLSENTMGQNDLAEIKDVEQMLTKERIDSLITRLTNAKTTLENIRSEISKFTFAGRAVKDLTVPMKISDLRTLLSKWDNDIMTKEPKDDNAYNSVIENIKETVEQGEITDTWGDSESSPDLTKQQRDLYTWLYNNFYKKVDDYSKATAPNETESADDDMTNMEADLKKQADDQKPTEEKESGTKPKRDMTKYLNPDLDALPSTRWDGIAAAIAEGKIETDADAMLKQANDEGSNMLTQLVNIAANLGRDLRDNLYVSEYMMSMFSYDTIEAELYTEMNGSSDNFQSFYNAPAEGSTTYTVKEGFEEYAAELQTMTKVSINPSMNYLYGEEVEYMLYGNAGKAGVYGSIFLIRFALNTVYAFTDAEINNVTLAAATALFGTPPLTPMIPFAKAAMIIGLAIAETSWDLAKLRMGEAIPLMKNNKTWVMSPTGVGREAKELAMNTAKEIAYKGVEKGYQVLNDAISMTSEELQALIDSGGKELEDMARAATATVTSQIQNKANEALQEVVELCNSVNQQFMMDNNVRDENGNFTSTAFGSTQQKVDDVIAGLNSWMDSQSQEDPAIQQAMQIAVDYLTANNGTVISEIFDTIQAQNITPASGAEDLSNLLAEKLNSIREQVDRQIEGAIGKGVDALGQVTKDIEDSLKNAAREGADKLKETLGGYIDSAFSGLPEGKGTASTANASTAMASLLSWKYSDYLRVFVVVGLFANEELMLLRMADMIELNMQHKNNDYAVVTTTETVTTSRFFGLWKTTSEEEVDSVNQGAYSLNRAYTYLTIDATLQIKPLMMTLPFMAETVRNKLTGTNWYEIHYTGTLGY